MKYQTMQTKTDLFRYIEVFYNRKDFLDFGGTWKAQSVLEYNYEGGLILLGPLFDVGVQFYLWEPIYIT